MKVLILKGIPASGKSTYAKKLVKENPELWKRTNKDDLRAMLDMGFWSEKNEKFVLATRDYIILNALDQGYNVVVDDTNIGHKHVNHITQMLLSSSNPRIAHAEVDVKYFPIEVEEAIKRDAARENSVGESVVRKWYKALMDEQSKKPYTFKQKVGPPVIEPYVKPIGKPKVILCDIDGTLAHMTEKGRLRFGKQAPYAWAYVGEDELDEAVRDVLVRYHDTIVVYHDGIVDRPRGGLPSGWGHPDQVKVILFSGRDSVCRPETEQWLEDNGVPYHELYMRPEKDSRKDNIIKLELFNEHIRDNYDVLFVLDDRNQVVEMWRELGVQCFQVAAGDF
jgi:predicted kinase